MTQRTRKSDLSQADVAGEQAMRTLTVSLSPKQVSHLRQAVQSGDFASNSEVVRDALRLWERRNAWREAELAALKKAHAEGLASGPGVAFDAKQLLAEFKAEARSRG
jgi:antitoxin ParD1/3/4